MKYLTIRMKVTLWYAFFMLLLIMISLIFISELSRRAMLTNQKEHLIETVTDAIGEMESPQHFDYFDSGIFLMLYGEDNQYENGIIPDGFSVSVPLLNDYVQTIEANGQEYYVYDKQIEKTGRTYWLRGVVPRSAADPTGALTVRFVSAFLPILMLLTCVIGYFITKRAFRPVEKIQETAQHIADSNELSLRIGLPEGKDEIARLAKTVDHMLDKLERSFEKEKQFTSDVSHELRTPLAVILTESEYALQYADSLEEVKESMTVVNRQADRMSVLINQLLFFTRSDDGSLELKAETFDALLAVKELAEDYRILTEGDDTRITVTGTSAESTEICADKTLFIRCLSNLIQNAINYSEPGRDIEIRVRPADKYLAIAVKDNGIGIHAKQLERIWDRFYQVEESRNKSKGDNMGLGLAMVKTIVDKHHGFVTVESVPGEGSTFTLHFPI